METMLMALGAFGAVFFLVRGAQGWSRLRSMTSLEARRIQQEEVAQKEQRLSPRQKLAAFLKRHGYDGNLFSLIAAIGFLYLFLLTGMAAVGIDYQVGWFIALPAAAAAMLGVFGTVSRKRHRKFNEQLIELLELVSTQAAAGHGTHRALTTVTPTLPDPMRTEMTKVLDDYRATRDLVEAVQGLEGKYPSRALSMFISALEIDRAEGQAIGPALRQAAALLKADFALAAEARAEISQTRGEFLAVTGILALIAWKMILGSGPDQTAVYLSGVGLMVLGLGFANAGFGVWRFLRILKKVRGDV